MTLHEARLLVAAAIAAAFPQQQDRGSHDVVDVRVDKDAGNSGAFWAAIQCTNAADHLRARMVVTDALRGERVTFPQTGG